MFDFEKLLQVIFFTCFTHKKDHFFQWVEEHDTKKVLEKFIFDLIPT